MLPRVLLGLWVVLFVGFLGGTMPQYDATLRVAAEIIGVVPAVVWALFRLRGPRFGVDVAIVVALVAHTIASLTSVDTTGSLDSLGMAIGFALLFWLMRDVAATQDSRGIGAFAAVVALGSWLIATGAAWVAEKVEWVATSGRVPNLESFQVFIWGTANVFPVLLLMAIGFAIWLPGGPIRRSAIGILAAVALIIVPFSAGRAGWLGILVALLALELLLGAPASRRVARAVRLRLPALYAFTFAGALAVAAFLVVRYGGNPANGFLSRFLLWGEAIEVASSSPLTGAGPSTFSWVRLQHSPDFVDRPAVILAHNVPFQTLADGGVVLTIGLCLVAAVWIRGIWQSRHSLSAQQRMTAAIVIGAASSQLLDDFSFLPAFTAMLVTLAAWALPASAGILPARRRLPFFLPLTLLSLAALSLPSVMAVDLARLSAADARSAAVLGDWDASIAGFRHALQMHPLDAGYELGLAVALAQSGRVAEAQSAYERARLISPGDPRADGGLAAISGDGSRREQLLEEAARSSNDPQYAYRLALELANKDAGAAANWMAHAVVLEPQLIGMLEEARTGVAVERVVAHLPTVAAAVGSIRGFEARMPVWDAGLYESKLPPDAPAAWQAVAAAVVGEDARARGLVELALRDRPYDARTYQAAAAVDLIACREEEYRHDLLLEDLAGGSYAPEQTGVHIDLRDGVYREPGLGDYQPSTTPALPTVGRWPMSLIPPPPACAWGP